MISSIYSKIQSKNVSSPNGGKLFPYRGHPLKFKRKNGGRRAPTVALTTLDVSNHQQNIDQIKKELNYKFSFGFQYASPSISPLLANSCVS